MSSANGVIRIGRKGTKKFAFGDDGPAFEVQIVDAFQTWAQVEDPFRTETKTIVDNETGQNVDVRIIPLSEIPAFHEAALGFVESLAPAYKDKLTKAEALEFIARLREQYDELADFFQPKLPKKPGLTSTSESGLQFTEEPGSSASSTN